jgi:hypothetical protein
MSLGTGAWYGPSGDCGCCGDRERMPVCCPEIEDCMPEGYVNFSSVRAVVELTDTFTFLNRVHIGICSGPCIGQERVITREYEISGLSAVNGTYDAKFVQRIGLTNEWEETDPSRLNICGAWFLPWIEIEVFERLTASSDWLGGCFANSETITDGPSSVFFNPYYGLFTVDKTNLNWPFLTFSLNHPGLHPVVLRCDPGQQDSTFTPYTCKGGSVKNFTRLWHAESEPRPVSCDPITAGIGSSSLRGVMGTNTVGDTLIPDAGPIGFDSPPPTLTTQICDGVEGTTFGGCDLQYQSLDRTILAYSDTDVRNANCHPTVPNALTNILEWSEFNRKHSILINV